MNKEQQAADTTPDFILRMAKHMADVEIGDLAKLTFGPDIADWKECYKRVIEVYEMYAPAAQSLPGITPGRQLFELVSVSEKPDEGKLYFVLIDNKTPSCSFYRPSQEMWLVDNDVDGRNITHYLRPVSPSPAIEGDNKQESVEYPSVDVQLEWKDAIIEQLEKRIEQLMQSPPEDERHLRPVVKWFAEMMELNLKSNDHKGGWLSDSSKALLKRLKEETKELGDVIKNYTSFSQIIEEAADVANFAMMIADLAGKRIGQLKPEIPDGCEGYWSAPLNVVEWLSESLLPKPGEEEAYESVIAIKDQDGHWYVIPKNMKQDFLDMEERVPHDEYEAFNEKYSEYLTGGDLNLVQLYRRIDGIPFAGIDARIIIEDLLEAIPKQTQNADWWDSELVRAVEEAKKFIR